MRIGIPPGSLWCFVILLLVIVLVFVAAALVARQERRRSGLGATRPLFARAQPPLHDLAASAPLEGLAALHHRLQELHRHLPPYSQDSAWLTSFAARLRETMDEIYGRLARLPEAERNPVLARLATEVAALDSVVQLHLGASLNQHTDHDALEAQLEALRRSVIPPA